MSDGARGYRTVENELIGTGDGVTKVWPLRVAGDVVRNVVLDPAPVIYRTTSAPITVTDYTLATGPKIILPEPLPMGAKLYWSGRLYYDQRPTLLPPNAPTGTRALEASTARIGGVDTPLRALWDPYTCPIDILPWLAWALSMDAWKSYWTEAVKRERVAQAIAIQRRKGSVKSVYDVVRSFGADITLTEWWQMTPPATPHTFDLSVVVTDTGTAPTTADFVDDVITAVEHTKPVRSHFTFTQGVVAEGGVGIYACARAVTYRRITCEAI